MDNSSPHAGLLGRLRSIPAPGRSEATISARRAVIVQSCIEELRENGFSKMKVESVARRAGIDKRTLYDYVSSKEDLLLLVFADYLPSMLGKIRQARDSEQDPKDQLASMLQVHSELLSNNPHFVLFHYRELRHLSSDDQAAVYSLINDIHHEYERVFIILENREQLPTSDAVLNASSALTMLDMIGLHRFHLKTRTANEIANHIVRVLLGGHGTISEESSEAE